MGGVNVTNDFSGMMQGLAEVIQGDIANTGKLSPETEERLKQVEQLTAQMATPEARASGVGKAEETAAVDAADAIKTIPGLHRGKRSLLRMTNKLKGYIDKGENVTGPQHMFGTVPILGEIIMSGFAPRAYALEQSAVEVIMPTLKPSLGGNFSAREFDFARGTVFNPRLSEEENLERMTTYYASMNSNLTLIENLYERYFPNAGKINLMAGDMEEMTNRYLENLDLPTRQAFQQELEALQESNFNHLEDLRANGLNKNSMQLAYQHLKVNGASESQLKEFATDWIEISQKEDTFKTSESDSTAQKETEKSDMKLDNIIKNKESG